MNAFQPFKPSLKQLIYPLQRPTNALLPTNVERPSPESWACFPSAKRPTWKSCPGDSSAEAADPEAPRNPLQREPFGEDFEVYRTPILLQASNVKGFEGLKQVKHESLSPSHNPSCLVVSFPNTSPVFTCFYPPPARQRFLKQAAGATLRSGLGFVILRERVICGWYPVKKLKSLLERPKDYRVLSGVTLSSQKPLPSVCWVFTNW